jgi:hypothetical protein
MFFYMGLLSFVSEAWLNKIKWGIVAKRVAWMMINQINMILYWFEFKLLQAKGRSTPYPPIW